LANQDKGAELLARLESLPFSRPHLKIAVVTALGFLFDAADFALFGSALPSIAREFHLGPAQAGMLATMGLIGASFGAIFWGTISDYIGRKTSYIATILIFAVFTGLTATSWDIVSLGSFRFIANFGLGGLIPVSNTLMSEFMPSQVRGRVTSWASATFPVGLALAAGLSLLFLPEFGWRVLFLTGVLPIGLVFFVHRYMYESVRFLIEKRRFGEVEKIVAELERQSSGVIRSRDTQSRQVPDEALSGVEDEPSTRITVLDLLSIANRRTTLLLWTVSFFAFWSANGLLFMLPIILTQRGIPVAQAISFALVQGIFGVLGLVACGYLIDRFGRRPVLTLYFLVGAALHLWFAEASGIWMYVAIAGVGWVNPGVFGPSTVYACELYPTQMRATAVGWYYGIGRVGSFIAPSAIGFLLAAGYGQYVLHTFALTYLLAALAVFMIGVETRGRVLEGVRRESTGRVDLNIGRPRAERETIVLSEAK
jgi:MFS transporter, putative metabolite:H+ symporter